MTATLHLIKLCVGAKGPDDLARWQTKHFGDGTPVHTTRMWPKREAELLDGGSIYWVFKGMLLARQRLLGFDQVVGADGISRCAIRLDKAIVRVSPTPRRAFQGWRYLPADEAPPDLSQQRSSETALPAKLAAELAEMGLR